MSTNTTWVIAHESAAARELVSGATALGQPVAACLLGTAVEAAAEVVAAGAGSVVTIGTPEGALLESAVCVIAATLKERGARLVLVQASVSGRLIAGQLASALGTSALNASELVCEGDTISVKYLVFGGTALCTRRVVSEVAVVTVGAGVLPPVDAPVAGSPGSIEALDGSVQAGAKLVSVAPKQGEQVNLSAATRVVGVGRGFAAEADLSLARELASAIGAELACSRPITEGEDWMARERYIGVSGAVLKPEVYIAIGISGQVQHMVGVNQARTIIAINKDKNAPVFKQADVGIVGDLYEVVPALTAALRV